ncbi:MAG TPA: SGNH/GDSL hydrolase family protein [Noviherbaspirillum sp.]|jgi:lysophospholipase L1-like esterase|uniref:SGNH/GDSL hydrolase family protein n=1 Tax=Noviherbaspirillum sp. TaxID=1926288 RepID=UPI002F959433
MRPFHPFLLLALTAAVAAGAGCATGAREEAQDPAAVILDARWEASLAAFAKADRERAPQPDGVLFVGSSSIRLWDKLEQQFDMLPVVIKRGFGGSRMEDCAAYVDRLVLPYQPKLVLVYAGENDLAEGRTPQQVFDSFRRFAARVHEALPQTRIAYISIKPSPSRQWMAAGVRTANALIRSHAERSDRVQYIDVHTPMLDEQGHPRAELFRDDALHLNDEGYALWKSVILSRISEYAASARRP